MTSTPDRQATHHRGTRDFDIVVLGATGLTGRLVVAQLISLNDAARTQPATGAGGGSACRWAVAGRDRGRLDAVLAELGAAQIPAIVADVTNPESLAALAERTTVLLNLAGPYTPGAEAVIEACIAAGTSYADLSGEIPLLQRVNRRFDHAAVRAGVAVVQMAGWEAMPADLTTLLACRTAVGSSGSDDGPGANDPIATVDVTTSFTRLPEGNGGLGQSVSGGTLASIVAMLCDDGSAAIGDPAALLPERSSADSVRITSPLRLLPFTRAGRGRGPVVPVAFLDPPIIHRTAALLAADQGVVHAPATFDERNDLGPSRRRVLLGATALAAVQRTFIIVACLPSPFRRLIAAALRHAVPKAGTGPSGHFLTDWSWQVHARATSRHGGVGEATMTGTGHPGYTATAAMITMLGIHLAQTPPQQRRSGCLTPATAFGADGAIDTLNTDELRIRVQQPSNS